MRDYIIYTTFSLTILLIVLQELRAYFKTVQIKSLEKLVALNKIKAQLDQTELVAKTEIIKVQKLLIGQKKYAILQLEKKLSKCQNGESE